MLGQRLRVLDTHELRVVGRADVDQGIDVRGSVGGVEGGVVDGVAVDLADVEGVSDLGDAGGDYSVGDAPDLL